MNFLELVQMAARESGTISGTAPAAVTGQSGRLLKFVSWTAQGWTDIQNARSSWRWMRAEFESPLTAGAPRYTAASFSLARWAEWIGEPDTLTLYRQSEGVADEAALGWVDWPRYRATYERGAQTANRPVDAAISPAGELCFGPRPDATYIVRGEYRKSPQTLTAGSDTPEMPARFHALIAWKALLLMAEHDEAPLHIGMAIRRHRELMSDLERDQMPRIHVSAEPLA
jgi:hypothetical protein